MCYVLIQQLFAIKENLLFFSNGQNFTSFNFTWKVVEEIPCRPQ